LRDIGEARVAIENRAVIDRAYSTRSLDRPIRWMIATVLMALVTAAAGFGLWRATRPADRPLMRFTHELGEEIDVFPSTCAATAISPDGKRFAYFSRSDGQSPLMVRLLASAKSTLLSGADVNAAGPFFSPDGRWIGFFAGSKLKKISVEGGAAVTLCDVDASG